MRDEIEEDAIEFVVEAPEVTLQTDAATAAAMGRDEVAYLVESYYEIQTVRVRASNREKALAESGKPSALMAAMHKHWLRAEGRCLSILRAWGRGDRLATWAQKVVGIGPVIAAGLSAHLRVEDAPTPSAMWRYAGLDPTAVWLPKDDANALVAEALEKAGAPKKGALQEAHVVAVALAFRRRPIRFLVQARAEDGSWTRASVSAAARKRPWNARLRVLCWKLGESFKRVSGNPASVYGRLYRERKAFEVAESVAGRRSEEAERVLRERRLGPSPTKDAYERGELPAGRMDLRATRYAVKRFLAHYWHQAHLLAYPGKPVPRAWVHDVAGHAHEDEPEVPYES